MEDDSGTEHFGGKNDKRTKTFIPEPMLNPMLLLF